MKWTYLCKWILAILVVVGLSYLHFQVNFIPKGILPFVGIILIVVILKIFQAYEKFREYIWNKKECWQINILFMFTLINIIKFVCLATKRLPINLELFLIWFSVIYLITEFLINYLLLSTILHVYHLFSPTFLWYNR